MTERSRWHWRLATLAAALAAVPGAGGVEAGEEPGAARLGVTVIQRIEIDPASGIDPRSLVVAPRAAHVAWQARREGGARWVVDGKEGEAFDAVGPLVFSDDGAHWAYAARRKGAWRIVVGGAEKEAKDLAVREKTVRFVPGAARVAYVAKREAGEGKGLESLVVDGTVGPGLPAIDDATLAFSADGARHAFRAKGAEGDLVVVDGAAGKAYPKGKVSPPVFSGDGRHVAYAVTTTPGFVVTDGNEGKSYDGVTPPVAAPKGPRFAYGARRGDRTVVVAGAEEGPEFLDVSAPGPVFSPDGARVAYVGMKAPKDVRVVVDGKESPAYGRAGGEHLRWSPDGTRLAYWAGRGPKPFWVVDGKESPEYDLVGGEGNLAFSADSKRVAYAAKRRGKWVVVTDGVEGPECDGVAKQYPRFSPDGKRVAYVAVTGGRWRMVVNGEAGPDFDGVTLAPVAFGEDGSTLGFCARVGNLWHLVVETAVSAEDYQAVLSEGLVADGPRSFHGWLGAGNEILHVRAILPP